MESGSTVFFFLLFRQQNKCKQQQHNITLGLSFSAELARHAMNNADSVNGVLICVAGSAVAADADRNVNCV